jgi:hypothetical protein
MLSSTANATSKGFQTRYCRINLASIANVDFVKSIATGEPFAGMLAGQLPLVWAHARVICDSPEKKKVEKGAMVGMLMHRAVADAALQS